MEHIFILNINQLKDEGTFRYYFNEMSRERQDKITQHKMESDRRRSLGAGIALNAILKQYGLNPRETRLEYGTNGKASVAGRPDIHFNLTHSGDYAAGVCGVSPVGIDIEGIGVMKEKVARRFFHEGEYRYLEQIEDGQQLSLIHILDTATTGLIPQYACDAMNTYLQNRTDLAMDIDDYHWQWEYADDVRDGIAEMIGAESGNEIAFGQNSSSLFNIFCNGLVFEKGDNVVIYENAFPAMTYVWLNLREQLGLEVRVAGAVNGETAPESLFSLDRKSVV